MLIIQAWIHSFSFLILISSICSLWSASGAGKCTSQDEIRWKRHFRGNIRMWFRLRIVRTSDDQMRSNQRMGKRFTVLWWVVNLWKSISSNRHSQVIWHGRLYAPIDFVAATWIPCHYMDAQFSTLCSFIIITISIMQTHRIYHFQCTRFTLQTHNTHTCAPCAAAKHSRQMFFE